MKKYLLVLVGLCCVLSHASAEHPDSGQTHYIFYYPTPVFILFI